VRLLQPLYSGPKSHFYQDADALVVSSLVSFVYVRLRSCGIQINAVAQVVNVNGTRRTVIPTPENRKVGGSTPPLATTSEVGKPSELLIFGRALSN